jgi:hypothetical protein
MHGNANNLGANAQEVVGFHRQGLNVFIIDYRGYGESTGGPPREKLAYEDDANAEQHADIGLPHCAPVSAGFQISRIDNRKVLRFVQRDDAAATIADPWRIS